MRALFIGDVVGPAAVAHLVDRVPRLRAELALAPSVAAFGRRPWDAWSAADRPGTVIVDYHGQSDMEKQAFAHAVDGSRGTPREAAPPVRVAAGPNVLGAVLPEIAAGRTTAITRVT